MSRSKKHVRDPKGEISWEHQVASSGQQWLSLLRMVLHQPAVGEMTIVKSISMRFDGPRVFLVVRGQQLRGDVVQMRQDVAEHQILNALCAILRSTKKWKPDRYGSYASDDDLDGVLGGRKRKMSRVKRPEKDGTYDPGSGQFL